MKKLFTAAFLALFCIIQAAGASMEAENDQQVGPSPKFQKHLKTPLNTFHCPSPNGYFPVSPDACQADYYMCVDNTPYPQHCPSNFVFDPEIRVCQTLERAFCVVTTVQPTTWKPTTPKPFNCPSSDGCFPISLDICQADYYLCVGYISYRQHCPGNLVFDPLIQACNTVERASCVSTTMHPTTSKPTSRNPYNCPFSNGYFSILPDHCEPDYYLCVDYMPYPLRCPGNLVFDPIILSCQILEKANCGGTTTPSRPSTNPTTRPSTNPTTRSSIVPTTRPSIVPTTRPSTTSQPLNCKGHDGCFPKPGNCEQFIVCSNGIAHIMNCPSGLYFNPTTLVCDYESIVDCNK